MSPVQVEGSPVRVYAADALALDERRIEHLASLLDPSETQRAARFVFPKHRRRFIAAHGFLREVLARETSRDARALAFDLGPHGKPALADSDVRFNLTHTGEHALIAVGDLELGLDAEQILPARVDGPLAERVMTAAEFETWSRAPRAEQVTAFFRLWSAKESVMKATGLGLQLSPHGFGVFAPHSLALCESIAIEGQVWMLHELASPAEFSLVLATRGAARVLRIG